LQKNNKKNGTKTGTGKMFCVPPPQPQPPLVKPGVGLSLRWLQRWGSDPFWEWSGYNPPLELFWFPQNPVPTFSFKAGEGGGGVGILAAKRLAPPTPPPSNGRLALGGLGVPDLVPHLQEVGPRRRGGQLGAGPSLTIPPRRGREGSSLADTPSIPSPHEIEAEEGAGSRGEKKQQQHWGLAVVLDLEPPQPLLGGGPYGQRKNKQQTPKDTG